jgi:hypothetical protein
MNYIRQIINYIRQAQEIAAQHGFKNLLQPGLVKELVVADILGHEVHKTKHEPDAFDPAKPERKFEYLSCFEGGTFQLDRMFRSPQYKRAKSLERITRNTAIYCAVFDKESPLDVLAIYEVTVGAMLRETERQLDASSNEISHVGFTIKWAQQNGEVVYTKQA